MASVGFSREETVTGRSHDGHVLLMCKSRSSVFLALVVISCVVRRLEIS